MPELYCQAKVLVSPIYSLCLLIQPQNNKPLVRTLASHTPCCFCLLAFAYAVPLAWNAFSTLYPSLILSSLSRLAQPGLNQVPFLSAAIARVSLALLC